MTCLSLQSCSSQRSPCHWVSASPSPAGTRQPPAELQGCFGCSAWLRATIFQAGRPRVSAASWRMEQASSLAPLRVLRGAGGRTGAQRFRRASAAFVLLPPVPEQPFRICLERVSRCLPAKRSAPEGVAEEWRVFVGAASLSSPPGNCWRCAFFWLLSLWDKTGNNQRSSEKRRSCAAGVGSGAEM